MKFKDFKYERVDVNALKTQVNQIKEVMRQACDYATFKAAFDQYGELSAHVATMMSLGNVRYTIDTRDEFYKNENDFWDNNSPLIQAIDNEFNQTVLSSKFVEELKKDVPETYFLNAEFAQKAFDEKIVPDLQEENKLASAYQALIASSQIEFDGETYTLASIGSKMEDNNRDVRKRAMKAYWDWFSDHESELDDIYDRMVKVRDGMAKKLGYKNFIKLGYYRMRRFDYNADDVANYRKQILEDIVPVANKLYAAQAQRLGYNKLACYDEKVEFLSGNPTPKHNKDEMVKYAQKMYHELSPETGAFFDFMVEHDLLDLVAKPGKAGGGYCTGFPEYKAPFIFSNFNGTSGDVDVLTHEAGHAFQVFSSFDIKPVECIWPTYESCEIHSMSMEFFTHPWMHGFFEEDTDKYYYLHPASAVKFLPYGILIDHYQHEVYEHPEMTPDERKAAFRKLEKMYLPHKDYEGFDILEKGCWWYRQLHVFMDPFYYVDYTLAQVCALQFWIRMLDNDPEAFNDYYKICKIGGTKTFKEIVKAANLKIPFEDGCLKEVVARLNTYFDDFKDKAL